MANRKVGVYRKYLEAVPVDSSGRLLTKSSWPKKRSFCWVARWFSSQGKRHSRSFRTKRQAQSFAAQKQAQIQDAQTAGLTAISLRAFHIEHKELTQGNVASRTLFLHLATLESLADFLEWDRSSSISPVRKPLTLFRPGRPRTIRCG